MKNILLASAAVLTLGGSLFADTLATGSTGQLISITGTPISTFVSGSPAWSAGSFPGTNGLAFWNNPSSDTGVDGKVTNVGDVLAGLATGTNEIGTNLSGTPSTVTPNTNTSINGSYYAMSGGTDPISDVSGTSSTPGLEFSFVSTQTAQTISLLFADSGNDTGVGPGATKIGLYILQDGACGTDCVFTPETTIDGAVADNTTGTAQSLLTTTIANNGTGYGYYATVCYMVVGNACTESITYTTGDGNFSSGFSAGNGMLGALGWNHWAMFDLADGTVVLGFTDTPFALASNTEGQGDFNDAVLSISGNPTFSTGAPEPGTIAIMGLGLAALGVLGRRRFVKK